MKMFASVLTFFGFSEDDEDKKEASTLIHNVSSNKSPAIHNIMDQTKETFEIRISFPRVYEDSINIATHLQKDRAVLVNLQYLDPSTCKRLIDFLCGTAYAMGGNMKKVTDVLFVFSPKNILLEMAEDISDIEKADQEYESYKIDHVASNM